MNTYRLNSYIDKGLITMTTVNEVTATKVCKRCNTEKLTTDFCQVKKNKDGLNYWCKKCCCEYNKSKGYHSAKSDNYNFIISNRWKSINQRTQNGIYNSSDSSKYCPQLSSSRSKNNRTVNMTKDEFTTWMLSVEETHNLITSKGETSSIDRIDENKGYEIGNLQLISLHQNIEKRYGKVCKYRTDKEEISERNRKAYQRAKNARL